MSDRNQASTGSSGSGKTLSQRLALIVRTAWFLWAGFVFSMAVYGVVPRFITLDGDGASGLGTVFWALAAVLAGGALAYRKWAFSDDTLRKAMDPKSGVSSREQLGGLDPSELRFLALARAALRHQIVVLAIIEAIAVLGFVYALLTRDASLAIPFVGLAIGLAVLSFPRVREVLERGKAWR